MFSIFVLVCGKIHLLLFIDGWRILLIIFVSIFLGTDFGLGGAIEVDGKIEKYFKNDLWWGYRWNHPDTSELSILKHRFTRGNHQLIVTGLEGCCDGSSTYQFQQDGDTKWMDLTISNLKKFSGTSIIANDPDTGTFTKNDFKCLLLLNAENIS